LVLLAWGGVARSGEIHDAAKAGDVEKVRTLLKGNPDLVNAKDENGATPLHWAARYDNRPVAEVLLANKADVNARQKSGWTPLHVAVVKGYKAMVEVLLANKAEVNARDIDGKTPLNWAETMGHNDIAELLAAPPSETIQLHVKGKPGETYTTVYEMTTKVAPLDLTDEETVLTTKITAIRMWIETSVKEVKPKGRMLVSVRVKRYAVIIVHGADKLEFDSSDPASRETARQDPNLAPFLKLLNVAVQAELYPTGDMREFKMDGDDDPATRSLLEDEISQPIVLLPEGAVKILDTWDCGSRSRSFPGAFRVNIKLEGVLLDVRKKGDDQLATLGVKGDMTIEADPDAKAKVEFQDAKWGGLQIFSVKRGRAVSGYVRNEATLKITDKGEPIRLQVIGELHMEETK
jgi:hypothetical protein